MNKLLTTFGSVALITSLNVMLLLPTSAMASRNFYIKLPQAKEMKVDELVKVPPKVKLAVVNRYRTQIDSFRILRATRPNVPVLASFDEAMSVKGMMLEARDYELHEKAKKLAELNAVKSVEFGGIPADFKKFDDARLVFEMNRVEMEKLIGQYGSQGPDHPGVIAKRQEVRGRVPDFPTF